MIGMQSLDAERRAKPRGTHQEVSERPNLIFGAFLALGPCASAAALLIGLAEAGAGVLLALQR